MEWHYGPHICNGMACGKQTRNRVHVAAEEGEGEEPREAVSERWSLDELDQQLKVLSSREFSAPRETPIPRQTLGDPEHQQNTVNGSSTKLQWPNLTTGFFVYAAIGLLLLTVVNNVLFKIFLGPGVDRKEPSKTTVPYTPRFRITILQEERESREAEDAQQAAIAAQSKEAPLPLEEMLCMHYGEADCDLSMVLHQMNVSGVFVWVGAAAAAVALILLEGRRDSELLAAIKKLVDEQLLAAIKKSVDEVKKSVDEELLAELKKSVDELKKSVDELKKSVRHVVDTLSHPGFDKELMQSFLTDQAKLSARIMPRRLSLEMSVSFEVTEEEIPDSFGC